ncbi:hypothetical protein FG386_001807 [Cryptosporidium ryanae]|uniref:uncharacterized protein n=1 Tax=Cryptosporidium ryanae TaxID=515981 RepID=UPI003519DB83|nr:hypothetical protein FG386_001807 [Cryptosporidium ryanae]
MKGNKKIVLSLLLFGCAILNSANCQNEEKKDSELRSLGHKRTIVEPYYVDRPVFVEQPVYYNYPYPYPYPYSFAYQYPYAYSQYSNYPYNYSYSYSRTTRPATGVMPPFPPPPPYLRYLGEKQENDEKDSDELKVNQRGVQEFIGEGDVILPEIQQDDNPLFGEQETSPQTKTGSEPLTVGEASPQQPGEAFLEPVIAEGRPIMDSVTPVLMKKIESNSNNSTHDINTVNDNKKAELPEIILYNNSNELRVLGKKDSIINTVEKTFDLVLDRIKIGNSDSDDEGEKEDDKDNKEDNKDNKNENKNDDENTDKKKENKESNLKRNNNDKNKKNVIKQVFNKIEDIVTKN